MLNSVVTSRETGSRDEFLIEKFALATTVSLQIFSITAMLLTGSLG
jgi:hypothetical protein